MFRCASDFRDPSAPPKPIQDWPKAHPEGVAQAQDAGFARAGNVCRAMAYTIRRARPRDVRAIRCLMDAHADSGRLLGKDLVTLYEDVQEFWIAERAADATVVGCGALHVMWEVLAEIRTIAVAESCRGHGVGHRLVGALPATARELGVRRVVVLTFPTGFFARPGLQLIEATPVAPALYRVLLRAHDPRVAPFLDLAPVQ